ncbi:phosphotransferase [Streptomyces dioscori]|uniref:Phosphotransferase n=1 Tax=Streptomyces dioscori TaxID=2109333 RepID=A0A2P8QAW4_9ACTN|nr:aminoglycoside phosphotransferase family protein [Streptomyces dioscori]PSM43395.1 phosphotransferase [Streptomyces dioscori]
MPPAPKMNPDELDIDETLVGRLVAEQFPEWAGLSVERVVSAGTDNAMYRLGDDMVVRLPRRPGGAGQAEKEQRWLPKLAPRLPLAVPVPLAAGAPGQGYALPWGVFRWLDGSNVYDEPLGKGDELADAAGQLGRFVAALREVDAVGGSPSWRGGPLADDRHVRAAIRELGTDGVLDASAVTARWEDALRVPRWTGAPVWLHGDLLPGNLLAQDGRLSAVIDFGGLGTGDPAADVLAAWAVFDGGTRPLFREAAGVDDDTWARGRGWALHFGLTAEHHYRVTNPVLAAVGHRAVTEALADAE